MADQTLLSDLCTICNTTQSKYRCPACATRTCSLPCYKRHQQWAQCSGKRDPTQYVKKSQLATPAGIDHDYNYLTSIERDLGRADREVNDRLLGTQHIPSPSSNPWNKTPFDRRVTADGVHIIRAPVGLSRQRDNKSRLNKKKTSIIWSVEWIHQDETRLLSETQEHASLEEAYRVALRTQSEGGRKKRKRQPEEAQKGYAGEDDSSILLDQSRIGFTAPSKEAELPNPRRQSIPSCASDPSPGTQERALQMADNARASPGIDEPESQPIPVEHHFFLLKPRTSSSRHVLIPVQSSSSLRDCLHNRTVLEFPTIYVFLSSPPPVKDYVLEQDYLNEEAAEQKELDGILKANPGVLHALQGNMEKRGNERQIDELDPTRLLDVLQHDLGATKD